MKRAILVVALLQAGCVADQSNFIRIESAAVDNLYVLDGTTGDASLLSDTRAQFHLKQRCLVLQFDGKNFTPVFLRLGEPPIVQQGSIFVYSRSFPLGEQLSMPGLIPSDVRLTGGPCPRETIIVPSINGVASL